MANKVNVEISANVQGYVDGIDQATQSAAAYETETKKIADAQINLKKELATATKTAKNLAAGYAALSKEAKSSQFGQEMARQLQQAIEKAAELKDINGDVDEQIRNMASDTPWLDAMTNGVSGLTSGLSAATGVMGVFTDNTEQMQKAITLFTTAESIANGVTKVKLLLEKQSAVMIAVTKVQTLASTAAVNLETAAKSKNIVVTNAAKVAQAAFNAVAMMNPYVLLAMALVGVGAALFAFCSSTDDATDAQARNNREMEEAKKKHEEYQQALKDTEDELKVDLIGTYMELQATWSSLSTDMEKNQFIQDNQQKFKKLGYTIKDITDANLLLVFYREDVMNSFIDEAKAARQYKIALDQLKESIDNVNTDDIGSFGLQNVKNQFESLAAIQSKVKKNQAEINSHMSANLNKNKNKNTGGSTTPKKDPQVEYQKELNILQQMYNKHVYTELQYKEKVAQVEKNYLSSLQKEGKATPADVARAEAAEKAAQALKIEQDYQNTISELEVKRQHNIITEQEYLEGVVSATKALYEANVKAGTATQELADRYRNLAENVRLADPEKIKKDKEAITKILNDAFKIDEEPTYDFSNMPDAYKKEADKVLNQINRIEEARKHLMEAMNAEDASDTTIAESQRGLEQLGAAYDELAVKAENYQNINDAVKHFEDMKEAAEETAETFNNLSSVTGAVGDIFRAMGDDVGAAMMQVVTATLDMIAQVIPQIMALIGAKQAEAMASGTASAAKLPYPANLGAIASIIATVLGTFASIWSAIKGAEGHADGGIVGGGSYSGDKILTRLNAGEMVLNQRQQRNLFSLLDQGAMPSANGTNVTVTGVVRGTDLLLVQKNTTKIMKKRGTSINF